MPSSSKGTSPAEANDISDYSAAPYWSNRWWLTQSPQYDDYGWWFKPGYWKWVPEHDGWYSVDCLNSKFAADGHWLSNAFYVQVMDGYLSTVDGDWDRVAVEVTAGQTYYVIVTCRYSNDALYAARVSAVAEWSEWIESDPVPVSGVSGLTSDFWLGQFETREAFGGRLPGHEPDAYECSWNWARRGNYGMQYWSPDGSVADGGVDGVPWSGEAGVCRVFTSSPVMASNSGTVGWSVSSDTGGAFLPATLTSKVWGVTHMIRPAALSQQGNWGLVSTPPEAFDVQFQDDQDYARIVELNVVFTSTPTSTTASKVCPITPEWSTGHTDWGAFLNSGNVDMAGGPGGPESAGAWSDYSAGGSIPVDIDGLNAAAAGAEAAGMAEGYGIGWLMYVVPAEALGSAVPAAVDTSLAPQFKSANTVRNVRLDAVYQPTPFRYVAEPTPPPLAPAAPLTWWDSETRREALLLGWWDGETVRDALLTGWADGSDVHGV